MQKANRIGSSTRMNEIHFGSQFLLKKYLINNQEVLRY